MVWRVPEQPPRAAERPGLGRRLLRVRIWIYLAAIVAILVLKLGPGIRSRFPHAAAPQGKERVLTVAGLDLAPVLIPRLITGYRGLYPGIDVRIHSGGTRQALQDLANRQADVAFLNRLPSREELAAIRQVADSVETFPIALGAIEVLTSRGSGIDSVTVGDLKAWLQGRPGSSTAPPHFYASDPNLGQWTALTSSLGLPESVKANVTWVAGEIEVAQAVAADPGSIGFASTLSLVADLDRLGARQVRVRGGTSPRAVLPDPAEIALGDYPLYHYLYLACLPDGGPMAFEFITFMYNGRGQRLVEREGFLPARQIARVVQLVQKPVG